MVQAVHKDATLRQPVKGDILDLTTAFLTSKLQSVSYWSLLGNHLNGGRTSAAVASCCAVWELQTCIAASSTANTTNFPDC